MVFWGAHITLCVVCLSGWDLWGLERDPASLLFLSLFHCLGEDPSVEFPFSRLEGRKRPGVSLDSSCTLSLRTSVMKKPGCSKEVRSGKSRNLCPLMISYCANVT